jgi:hypothetical protein
MPSDARRRPELGPLSPTRKEVVQLLTSLSVSIYIKLDITLPPGGSSRRLGEGLLASRIKPY